MDDLSDTSKALQTRWQPNANDFIGGRRMTINELRNQMYIVGQALGLSHPWTVALSQELDKHIIEAQKKGMAI